MFIVDESLGQTYTIQQKQFNFDQQSNQTAAFSYNVTVDGYYCVGVAEISSLATDESSNGNFNGRVVFHNIFKGNLPAAERPKLVFYGVMTLVYLLLGVAWLSLCTIHRDQIVTVQHFISAMIAFLVLEMACEWLFYAYYNNHEIDFLRFKSVDKNVAVTGMARFLLVLTSILGAARDSLSFFLLLIVSMGYGVVRPTIGSVIRKVQLLTGLHFIFGVLYSVGIVLILLEMGGTWTLLFIFPLAGTLSAFMSWILYSLKSTMQYLSERRQTYKFKMFQRLYLILMCAVVAIVGFFFFSSFLLATSDTSDLATTSWEYRWFVLDGSLTLLYFIGTLCITHQSLHPSAMSGDLQGRTCVWRCRTSWQRTKKPMRVNTKCIRLVDLTMNSIRMQSRFDLNICRIFRTCKKRSSVRRNCRNIQATNRISRFRKTISCSMRRTKSRSRPLGHLMMPRAMMPSENVSSFQKMKTNMRISRSRPSSTRLRVAALAVSNMGNRAKMDQYHNECIARASTCNGRCGYGIALLGWRGWCYHGLFKRLRSQSPGLVSLSACAVECGQILGLQCMVGSSHLRSGRQSSCRWDSYGCCI